MSLLLNSRPLTPAALFWWSLQTFGVKALVWATVMMASSGCGPTATQTTLTATVKQQTLAIMVPAKGDIVAANALAMSVPGSASGPQTIAWLIAENSQVKKGDVVARFDGETFLKDLRVTELDLQSVTADNTLKEFKIETAKANIKGANQLLDKEIRFSDLFNIDDLSVYSKIEIIEALDNRQYLQARKSYLGWELDNFSANATNDMELMALKAQYHESLKAKYETALAHLEVVAPHDGIVLYEQNWRGEKPRVGQTLWPGHKLATIPDMRQLNAKLSVLESEAGSVNIDDQVTLFMDALPDRQFNGVVKRKADIAKTIDMIDPVKYFEIVVSISDADPQWVKPGSKVTGVIHGQRLEQALVIPIQTVFIEANQTFVYLQQQQQWLKTPVVLGPRDFALVAVRSGVNKGDRIALYPPQLASGSLPPTLSLSSTSSAEPPPERDVKHKRDH